MNREPCKHGIVGHEDCETLEIERLEAALSAAESQLKAYAAQIYAADGFSGEHWRRVAKETEKERDEALKTAGVNASIALERTKERDAAANACAGDLANMRARIEAMTAEKDELRRELELYRAGLIEWKHRAEAAEAENVAKARAEALEEAARIAEGVTIATNCECTGSPCSHDQIHNDTVENVAIAIRAAKGGEG